MLTQEQLSIIKATVPVLQEHGEAITRVFYQTMFASHPELLDVFNENNQRTGEQPKSLAGAVLAYASNIDNLGALGEAVGRIGHKHASLEIKAEHYPIVGEYLLKAIKSVLGEAASPEIIDAWGAAYGQLADILIGFEGQLYKDASWVGFKPFLVQEKVPESDSVTSFYLVPKDGAPLPIFEPGQYTSVQIKLPNAEHLQLRQYSLSDAPGKPSFRLTIKRQTGVVNGLVSTHMHDDVQEGDEILLHAPMGTFTLDASSDSPVVFISGGVGITPLMSMLEHLVGTQSKREILFIHACPNRASHVFRDRIASLCKQNPNVRRCVFYEDVSGAIEGVDYDFEGLISLKKLGELVPAKESDYYICGPVPFMSMIDGNLESLGVPPRLRHYEVFGPTVSLESQTVTA